MQIDRVEEFLQELQPSPSQMSPVMVFNASTRIHTMSLNAAFSLLTTWGLRARGVPIQYLVCRHGMTQCILGTDHRRLEKGPPCGPCVDFSQKLFPNGLTTWLEPNQQVINIVREDLQSMALAELNAWSYREYPLGEICLPGLRWALRRHDLPDSRVVKAVYRQYLCSAASLVDRFEAIFDRDMPAALLLFNGITYPEAVARAVAERRGIRTITHEVGLQPQSAYFSHEEATFREVPIPEDYQLSKSQQKELADYLEARRRGRFTMAGVEFWPQMKALPEAVRQKMESFQRMVVIFSNVIFDTSQVHANVLFEDMFDWLDSLASAIKEHPDILFVLRAHPDENRPGKAAQQSVQNWFDDSELSEADNVLFYPPDEFVSSYQLIEAAHLVLVYNSSIGLEASIMGAPVLSGGRARYTQADTVFLPPTRSRFFEEFNRLLNHDRLTPPSHHAANACRFLYREINEASLDFSKYLKPYPAIQGMVLLEDFEPVELVNDETFEIIRQGLMEGKQFLEDRGGLMKGHATAR